MSKPLTIYFAGELFSAKHLSGNVALAEAIYAQSAGRYVSIIPQNLEQRETTAQAIRDQDLRSVLSCDVGLFHSDGTELDSGTVVEFLFAKFADIPSVLLRTDFRRGGDQGGDPWNLMTSFFPRTEVVTFDGMALYKSAFEPYQNRSAEELLAARLGTTAADAMHEKIAAAAIAALDRVVAIPPILPPELREHVYRWLSLMPGLHGDPSALTAELLAALQSKTERGLL